MSAVSAVPTAVNCNTHIRYNICYYITYFFQIFKIHYQHDQHLAVAIGEPHQNRMTEPATNRGTNRTADNRRGNTRIGAFWSMTVKLSAMLVKLSAVQTASNDQQNCRICDRQHATEFFTMQLSNRQTH